jgi:hypothetical protein
VPSNFFFISSSSWEDRPMRFSVCSKARITLRPGEVLQRLLVRVREGLRVSQFVIEYVVDPIKLALGRLRRVDTLPVGGREAHNRHVAVVICCLLLVAGEVNE